MPVKPNLLSATALVAALSATSALADITVYATTGYLGDAVAKIAPNADVITMVGPGGDPHTYQPSTKDIQTIQRADAVVWNGLYLEARMESLLKGLGDKALATGELLPAAMLLPWDDDLSDPHVWNSPTAWASIVGHVADHLSEIDPKNADAYVANAKAYIKEIRKADADATEMLASVPAENRILITGHDAFEYFGDTYGFEVLATDFVSTEAEMSPAQLADLAKYIADNKIPTIFQDNQANPQAIVSLQEAVQALGWKVEISGDELFADSLGAEADVDEYLEAFTHNVTAVAAALGQSQGN
ncbi:metal ABC transporter substrate-binding protein [Cognatishimia activa]|uniref:Tromp-1 n=1 Tax=Cognatishimia activa TaxID=1715691 RepID=A0A0P1JBR3_9RHOB|nr:metal ABC transporter substrate-binding protein [Cognatishimia activa]CUJ29800.1 Tromp-1 [Cognatishimia activa]CUK27223.1 Tromp-1 [Cognatishimia activa]